MAIKTTTTEAWALMIIPGYAADPVTTPFPSEEAAREFAQSYMEMFKDKGHHVMLVDGTVEKLELPK